MESHLQLLNRKIFCYFIFFYPLSVVSGVFCYRLVIFILHSHSQILSLFHGASVTLRSCAIECCADISLMDISPPTHNRAQTLCYAKSQKIFPNYFKHPSCQFERHFPSWPCSLFCFREGSWLLRKACKPHWKSIEVQSGSDTSNIPMNGRDVEFHMMASAYTRPSSAV